LDGIQALTDYETRHGHTPPVSFPPDSGDPEMKPKKKRRKADESGEPLPDGLLFSRNPEERALRSPRRQPLAEDLGFTEVGRLRRGDF
jgi:predicted RNase H-like nuclease